MVNNSVIDLNLSLCGSNGFNYSSETHHLEGIELMQCVNDKQDLVIQGTTSTEVHKYITVEVFPCANESWRDYDCAPHSEIVDYFSDVRSFLKE